MQRNKTTMNSYEKYPLLIIALHNLLKHFSESASLNLCVILLYLKVILKFTDHVCNCIRKTYERNIYGGCEIGYILHMCICLVLYHVNVCKKTSACADSTCKLPAIHIIWTRQRATLCFHHIEQGTVFIFSTSLPDFRSIIHTDGCRLVLMA